MRWLPAVIVLAACGDSLPARPDAAAAAPDAAVPPAPVITPFAPYPDVVIDGCAAPAGGMFPNVPAAIDDCVECMCSTWGGRCQRRAACARDVCVFVDGTTVARGETAVVAGCFDCTCGAAGPSCTRRTAAPCPADACVLPRGGTVAVGEKRFVSECHVCTCDAELGLACDDLCHPTCTFGDVEVPDQALLTLACTRCVCDYGDLPCADTVCP